MRKRFEQQNTLDAVKIPEVKIDGKSRHQLPKLLAGLQYIFITPELNERVFKILEKHIIGDSPNKRGRLGMSLWEIFVLGVVRLNMNMDYDHLCDNANQHCALRGILGIQTNQIFGEGKYYALQTVKDNIQLLTEELLNEINTEVVQAGHQLVKKKELEKIDLTLKTDSYVVESHVHFPTDINLLWDSIRKSLDTIKWIRAEYDISGWRKLDYQFRQMKNIYVKVARIHQRKGKNYKERLDESVQEYLKKSRYLEEKVVLVVEYLFEKQATDPLASGLLKDLVKYKSMLDKHIDLVERRIIKGEKIPHSEKVFSIFEQHVEWIQKGKHHKKVEIGHPVVITSDQYHFIVDGKVMVQESDVEQVMPLIERMQKKYPVDKYKYKSISFDKGFYSSVVKKRLEPIFEQVVMPKKGKANKKEQEEQSQESYQELRKAHSAVESNINELEQSGLDRVKDKGLDGFKKYVALGIVAHNLKRLGKLVIEQKRLSTIVIMVRPRKAAA